MATRCKFKCTRVETFGPEMDPYFQSTFSPVLGGSEENDAFYRFTPSGTLQLGMHREKVFEFGKHYYLDITEAE